MAGRGLAVGAAGAGGNVEAGLKPCVVGPYVYGGFGQTPKMYEQAMSCRKLTVFSFGFDYN